jgi:hypothetical protein
LQFHTAYFNPMTRHQLTSERLRRVIIKTNMRPPLGIQIYNGQLGFASRNPSVMSTAILSSDCPMVSRLASMLLTAAISDCKVAFTIRRSIE